MARAVAAGRDVSSARRALEGARADLVTAGVTPAMQLSLNTLAINPNQMGHGGPWSRPFDTILRLEQTLERGDKRAWRTKVAEAGVAAANLEVQATARLQSAAAAVAYWRLKLAQAQTDIARDNARLAAQGRDIALERLARGDLSRLETTRLSVEADRAANELAQSELQLQQARQRLRQVLALERDERTAALTADDPWPDDQRAIPLDHALIQTAVARRPEVRAAQERVAQAEAAVSLAEAQRKADITVGVQFEHEPPVGQRLWGIGVSVPLGVADRQAGPLAKALVQLEDARAEHERTLATAHAELENLLATWEITRTRLMRIERQLLPQAREALKASEYARTQGALGLQDLLDARRTLHAVELEHVAAQADHAMVRSTLALLVDAPVLPGADLSAAQVVTP
jgi:cobalt-zinc-cadmium efflux system outer membrane protein